MNSPCTRRDFAKLALAALPAAGLFSVPGPLRAAEAAATPAGRPNSRVNGVHIGLNMPYSFRAHKMPGEEILRNCQALNLSAVELRTQPVEGFLGLPAIMAAIRTGSGKSGAAPDNNTMKLREWRRSVSMDRVKDFRRMFEQGGVMIEILKVDGIFSMSDEEIDYIFTMAKTLGARALSTEIARTDREDSAVDVAKVTADLKRLGSFADKHQFMVGYHGHTHSTARHFEEAFSLARFNGANLDIGHYVAGGNGSPMEFLKRHHARVTHIHVKDRKWDPVTKDGPKVPFGEGDTPIREVLRLIRDHQWNIQATIEFDYPVPKGSTRMEEIARAVQYCRDALA